MFGSKAHEVLKFSWVGRLVSRYRASASGVADVLGGENQTNPLDQTTLRKERLKGAIDKLKEGSGFDNRSF